MAEQHLGVTIDIHGGGNDLKFPHHENEIAQSVCSHGGTEFARYWVHNGFVEIDSEKMSKSLGNVLLVESIVSRYPGEAVRLALINTRYREPLNWNEQLLEQSKSQLDRLYGALRRMSDVAADPDAAGPSAAFRAAMDDDLNTALAIATLMEAATRANTATTDTDRSAAKAELLAGGAEIGILGQDPDAWFAGGPGIDIDADAVQALVGERTRAREQRDWARADAIRDELARIGRAHRGRTGRNAMAHVTVPTNSPETVH